MRTFLYLLLSLSVREAAAQSVKDERLVESIVPWLDANSSCWSGVELQNLGNREVSAEVEAHKSSGALTALAGQTGVEVRLKPGEKTEFKLPGETAGAWVRVRERVPSPDLQPILAISGAVECVAGDQLQRTVREVTWPTRNPWYSGSTDQDRTTHDGMLALINATEKAAQISGCYSSGVLYSVPKNDLPGEFKPVCSERIQELVPPFGSKQFPMAHEGNALVSLSAHGSAIVLQMLMPGGTSVKTYKVDSTITFGRDPN